ncbi:MAG: cytochrome b6-f complex subunit PetG [Turicibacter sp.]
MLNHLLPFIELIIWITLIGLSVYAYRQYKKKK